MWGVSARTGTSGQEEKSESMEIDEVENRNENMYRFVRTALCLLEDMDGIAGLRRFGIVFNARMKMLLD